MEARSKTNKCAKIYLVPTFERSEAPGGQIGPEGVQNTSRFCAGVAGGRAAGTDSSQCNTEVTVVTTPRNDVRTVTYTYIRIDVPHFEEEDEFLGMPELEDIDDDDEDYSDLPELIPDPVPTQVFPKVCFRGGGVSPVCRNDAEVGGGEEEEDEDYDTDDDFECPELLYYPPELKVVLVGQ